MKSLEQRYAAALREIERLRRHNREIKAALSTFSTNGPEA